MRIAMGVVVGLALLGSTAFADDWGWYGTGYSSDGHHSGTHYGYHETTYTHGHWGLHGDGYGGAHYGPYTETHTTGHWGYHSGHHYGAYGEHHDPYGYSYHGWWR